MIDNVALFQSGGASQPDAVDADERHDLEAGEQRVAVDTESGVGVGIELQSDVPAGLPAERQTIGVAHQTLAFFVRALRCILRTTSSLVVLFGLTLVTAVLLGVLFAGDVFVGAPLQELYQQCPLQFIGKCASNQSDNFLSQGSMIALALGLVSIAASLNTFGGTNKRVFWRESLQLNTFAFWLGTNCAELLLLVLSPLLFVAIFAWLASPTVGIVQLYAIALGVVFAASGVGHLVSIVFADSRALIVSVLFVSISTVLAGVQPGVAQIEDSLGWLGTALLNASFVHHAVASFYLSTVWPFRDIYDLEMSLNALHLAFSQVPMAFAVPFIIGAAARLLALAGLLFLNKSKRR